MPRGVAPARIAGADGGRLQSLGAGNALISVDFPTPDDPSSAPVRPAPRCWITLDMSGGRSCHPARGAATLVMRVHRRARRQRRHLGDLRRDIVARSDLLRITTGLAPLSYAISR